jgi:mono/diheme cytochrome c family protein
VTTPATTAAGIAALAVLGVAGCGGGGSPAAPPGPGELLYLSNCLACHQKNGEGVNGLQPPLAGTPVTIGDADELLGWVMFGKRPAALPRGQFGGVMPQFAYLSDADLAALLTHVRSRFGNQAPPVTPEMVARARAAHRRA